MVWAWGSDLDLNSDLDWCIILLPGTRIKACIEYGGSDFLDNLAWLSVQQLAIQLGVGGALLSAVLKGIFRIYVDGSEVILWNLNWFFKY
jgi:hypothetical protein